MRYERNIFGDTKEVCRKGNGVGQVKVSEHCLHRDLLVLHIRSNPDLRPGAGLITGTLFRLEHHTWTSPDHRTTGRLTSGDEHGEHGGHRLTDRAAMLAHNERASMVGMCEMARALDER